MLSVFSCGSLTICVSLEKHLFESLAQCSRVGVSWLDAGHPLGVS